MQWPVGAITGTNFTQIWKAIFYSISWINIGKALWVIQEIRLQCVIMRVCVCSENTSEWRFVESGWYLGMASIHACNPGSWFLEICSSWQKRMGAKNITQILVEECYEAQDGSLLSCSLGYREQWNTVNGGSRWSFDWVGWWFGRAGDSWRCFGDPILVGRLLPALPSVGHIRGGGVSHQPSIPYRGGDGILRALCVLLHCPGPSAAAQNGVHLGSIHGGRGGRAVHLLLRWPHLRLRRGGHQPWPMHRPSRGDGGGHVDEPLGVLVGPRYCLRCHGHPLPHHSTHAHREIQKPKCTSESRREAAAGKEAKSFLKLPSSAHRLDPKP